MSANFCYPDYPLCDCDKSDATTADQFKSAEGFCRKTFNWSLEKSVDKDSWSLFKGDQARVCYEIKATKSGPKIVSGVRGVITIVSGAQKCPVEISEIVDTITYGPSSALTVVKQVVLATNVLIGPGQTLSLPYEIEFEPVDGVTQYQNRAHFTIVNHAGQNPIQVKQTSLVPFSIPVDCELVNDCVQVSDPLLGIDQQVCSSQSIKQYLVLDCESNAGATINVATLTGENGLVRQASVTVQLDCYELHVFKDARTSFTREWTWDVSKTANKDELVLQASQIGSVDYCVAVNAVKADRDLLVLGDIKISNPAPVPAEVKSIVDVVSANGLMDEAVVDCESHVILAAGESRTCHYSAAVDSKVYNLNTAIVMQQNYLYSVDAAPVKLGCTTYEATAVVNFAVANVTEINRCVIYDDNGDTLEPQQLCALSDADAAFQFKYTKDDFAPPVCPEDHYVFTNTAKIESLQGEILDEASHSVTVRINCDGGCTLTIGYWKTHSSYGPARWADETWLLVEPNGPDSIFYKSLQTWLQVAKTSPSGNVYYVLAHQYIASKLNLLAGTSSTLEVDQCIVFAEQFFQNYSPAQAAKLSPNSDARKRALECAAILDNYNNGLIGPGHCSE